MRWFAAHIVMMVEIKGSKQEDYPVWENLILIGAPSETEAYRRAEDLGREDEGDDGGTFRWGQRPAKWVFAGVRKLTECTPVDERPGSGDEISYTEFRFKSRSDVRRFVAGKSTVAVIEDRYRAIPLGEAEVGTNADDEDGTRERLA